MGHRRAYVGHGLFVLLALSVSCAFSQGYPNRPIKIVVPFTPGGGNDVFGRTVAQKLWDRLGQPVVVENKPGGGSIVGADYVAKSAPDGYTLLVAQQALILLPLVSKSLPFDVMKHFAPVGIGATQPMVVAVTNKLPVHSINGLIAYAKSNPGKLSYATPGIGTPQHLATEWFMSMTGTTMVQIPYKGAAGMLADLMSGEVQVLFGALNSAVPLIQSGKIRAIALAERQRLAQFKDVQTVNESVPGYEETHWYGLVAPAGTPDAILNRLAEEQRAIVNMPDVRKRLANVGMDSNPSTPDEMRRTMEVEFERWGQVAKGAGIAPQ
jgi:tripartite-type tricarboxylate transporter receptor subunit TctC